MTKKANISVFMDESGNTGSNLLDPTQPVFTFVGIGIMHSQFKKIENKILKLKEKYKVKTELHGTAIFRRKKEQIIREIAETLMKHNFQLFLNITEKRFVIASLIESDFFDPVYNDKCDNSWTHPSSVRFENANFLFKHLSHETINVCGKFFSTGNGINNAYKCILQDIKGKKYKLPLWEILQGAEPHLAELERITKSVLSDDNTIHTPNFFAYTGLINKIENHYRVEKNYCNLIFDSSKQFNASFLKALSLLQNAKPSEFIFPDRIPLIAGYTSILVFSSQNSEENIFLQCADILSSCINRVMTQILIHGEEAQLTDAELFTLVLIYFHWKDFEDIFCDYICSADLLYRIHRTLVKNQPT
ncbi:MAG: DUF3800 domain-containing protein [Nitrospirota bacterium]